ncbi:MAG: SIS domain-containing protein [Victivallaceae bacterium]|nr:SIS domain-containing protein [Victivallaceae bacterium]
MQIFIDKLNEKCPGLARCQDSVRQAAEMIIAALENDNSLYLCGNGGSAADCEHIAGELLKSFKCPRRLNPEIKEKFKKFSGLGEELAEKLEYGLRAIALTSHPSFSTAFANDVDASLIFAQQLFALARKGDVVLGISTGGNAENVKKCFITAKVQGVKTILLTGKTGGKCAEYADCMIKVPETETYLIQEQHVAIYHILCLIIEDYFYGGK